MEVDERLTLVGYTSVLKAEEHAVQFDGEGVSWEGMRWCCGCGGAWEDCERVVGGGCEDARFAFFNTFILVNFS